MLTQYFEPSQRLGRRLCWEDPTWGSWRAAPAPRPRWGRCAPSGVPVWAPRPRSVSRRCCWRAQPEGVSLHSSSNEKENESILTRVGGCGCRCFVHYKDEQSSRCSLTVNLKVSRNSIHNNQPCKHTFNAAWATPFPWLTNVDISNCPSITNVGSRALVQHPVLSGINVSGCDRTAM